MTFRFSLGLILSALSLSLSSAQAQIVPLFSTGVDGAGTPLGAGAIDPHYIIGVGDTSLAEVLTNQNPGGYAQSATSRWIWDAANGLPDETTLDFYTTFTLTQNEINQGVTLSGLWAADDTGSVFLNGAPLSSLFNSAGPGAWTAFSVSSGLVAGTNSLRFRVVNDNSVGGLNVDQLRYSVGSTAAPEPGSVVLLALGALGGVGLGRRRRG